MPRFDVNTERFDPYKSFKFRVRPDGRTVAGFSEVTAFGLIAEMVEYRGGVEPTTLRKVPASAKFDAVTLERGVTHDPEFMKWANAAYSAESGLNPETALKNSKKDIVIDVFSEAGELALSYAVQSCWVSQFQAAPDFDTDANAMTIETIRLENEGWKRDVDVTGR